MKLLTASQVRRKYGVTAETLRWWGLRPFAVSPHRVKWAEREVVEARQAHRAAVPDMRMVDVIIERAKVEVMI